MSEGKLLIGMLICRKYLKCPIECLCKSVILENKAWNGEEGNPMNSRYVLFFHMLLLVDTIW